MIEIRGLGDDVPHVPANPRRSIIGNLLRLVTHHMVVYERTFRRPYREPTPGWAYWSELAFEAGADCVASTRS